MKNILYGGLFTLLPLICSSQLFITEVYRDTPYSEYIDINYPAYQNPTLATLSLLKKRHRGEFIEIYNASDTALNLKDWKLVDEEGSYEFPDKMINSGQFIVVVANNNADGDYFPMFFSTTAGKESQILYQNSIKLNNSRESLHLVAKNLFGNNIIPYITSSFYYQTSADFGFSTGSDYAVNNPSVFYDVKDWQYGYSTPQTPNPLEASITPPIKSIEEYVLPYFIQNYNTITWDEDVDLLVNSICNINISTVSQNPNIITTSDGKSFNYDEAGNSSAANNYTPGSTPTSQVGYTSDELDQIKAAIQLSPNPTYDIVNVSITGIAQGKVSSVQVFSGNGAILFTKNNLEDSTNFNFSFNLVNQITGVYIANFILNTGQVVGKNVLKY